MLSSIPTGPRGSVELNVAAVVIMMPPIATAVVARNQSSVLANSDLIESSRHHILRALTKLIAHAANGLDHRPAAFQFAAQMADVHVDGTVERRGLAIVQTFHQPVARHHPPGISHELFQDIELESGHFNRLAIGGDLARAGVQRHSVDLHASAVYFILRAPQDGPDARRQFTGIERLWKIIVSPEFETHNAIHVLAARSQHKNWNTAGHSQAFQNLEPV